MALPVQLVLGTILTWLSWVFFLHLFPKSMVSLFARIGFTICRGSRYLWHPSHLFEWSVASIAWCGRDHAPLVHTTFAWNLRNNIPISRQDIPATNGLVHTIGQVSWLWMGTWNSLEQLGTNHILDTFVSKCIKSIDCCCCLLKVVKIALAGQAQWFHCRCMEIKVMIPPNFVLPPPRMNLAL